jgi:predicted outer membrane repeat protein
MFGLSGSRRVNGRALRVLIGLAGAFCACNAVAMITVGPDADTACQFHDVTSAVEAADQSPGIDLVAISTGTYTGVSTMLITSGDDLIVEGGFANCSAGISSGDTSTLDANGAVIHGSLFAHTGAGRLTLLHLTLQNGDASLGGGIDSEGSGELVLSDVGLYSNQADFGGGLFAIGGSPNKQVTLVGTRFNSNTAHGSGGGLYAVHADIHMAGGASYFLGNLAQGALTDSGDGAGFYVLDSNFIANTHGVPNFPFMGSNIADRNGGGAYFGAQTAGAYEFFLFGDDPTNPLELSDNAAPTGGAIYMKSESASSQILSFADLRNTIIRHNMANYGAVAALDSNGQSFSVATEIRFEQSKIGDADAPCAAGLECNLIADNIANSGDLIQAVGSGPTGSVGLEMFRARVVNNTTIANGGGAAFVGEGRAFIDGSLFAGNTFSGDLVAAVDADIHFANSTVAHNLFGGDELFLVALVPSSLEILHSLLSQPNDPVNAFNVGTSIPVTVHDVGAESVNGLPTDPGNNVQFLTDPFVDAANGDFHIRTTSSAVDRWSAANNDPSDPAPTLDLDGKLRPFVFNSTTTPYDFGAYEAGSFVDAIFIDGFD